jgi:hypothetical protein
VIGFVTVANCKYYYGIINNSITIVGHFLVYLKLSDVSQIYTVIGMKLEDSVSNYGVEM